VIEVERLHVHFGQGADAVHAVNDVSFHVREGESFGLVGESGSGKSTVLRVLCALQREWDGQVTIAGAPLPKRPARHFFRRLQMVFQDPYGSLHPRFTIDATLSEPLAVHRIGDRRDRIERVLEAVGLDPAFRFRFPHQLSGGQRQRVAIARALILEPQVLLLDEPTSALDVSVQAEILNLLARLREERGLTYLLVSHDLAVISHLCGRVGVMQAGRLVEQLPVERLRRGEADTSYTRELIEASRGPMQ
jgi:ABC-type dipeptide/oligopeptide/nickel transport system ATPase subunit